MSDSKITRVLFDGDCRFCQRQVSWMKCLDWRGRFQFLSAQVHGESFGIPLSQLMQSLHCIPPDGTILMGARAVRFILLRLPLVCWLGLILYLPGMIYPAEWVYRRIAEHRHCG